MMHLELKLLKVFLCKPIMVCRQLLKVANLQAKNPRQSKHHPDSHLQVPEGLLSRKVLSLKQIHIIYNSLFPVVNKLHTCTLEAPRWCLTPAVPFLVAALVAALGQPCHAMPAPRSTRRRRSRMALPGRTVE